MTYSEYKELDNTIRDEINQLNKKRTALKQEYVDSVLKSKFGEFIGKRCLFKRCADNDNWVRGYLVGGEMTLYSPIRLLINGVKQDGTASMKSAGYYFTDNNVDIKLDE